MSFAPSLALRLGIALVVAFPPLAALGQEAEGQEAAIGQEAEAGHEGGALGAVHFPVSCAPAVQAEFDRAVALLHHMMYVESREAFGGIAERDPGCAMAHWGIAMTLFQPLWPTRPGPEQIRRGWEEVRKAKELEPATDRERAFVAAVEAFYREPETAEWWTRISRWAESMQTVYEAYPDDIEAAAFYALSHLASGQVAEDRMAHQAQAAEILLTIYQRERTHPGAIHYTIHANDVDGRADESLSVVRSYDDIAPSVPHALHMPTHIYVRLGHWPEVIEWNRKSAEAALLFPAGDAVSHHYPHAMDYLVYAYLQRGEDEEAEAALAESLTKEDYQRTFISAFHLAAMPARYAVERHDWTVAAALPARTPSYLPWDRYPWPESLTWFARGLGAVRTGDLAAAHRAIERMEVLRNGAEEAGERSFAEYIEIDRLILAAWLARAGGKGAEALALARASAELEGATQKHPVTPGSLLPANEALGDLLMELGRPEEALPAYQASLGAWPRRFHSLLGAARAARAAGQDRVASRYYAELLAVVGETETLRSGVREARQYVTDTE
ncbi:MAG: hypothetical protein V3T97_05700 [Gemmatimonadota bacterium]